MEIERKFLIKSLPDRLTDYPCCHMEQGYLCTNPVVRVRREDSSFFLTYKGKGKLAREEVNLPLTEEAFLHLLGKADGYHIIKTRYRVPLPSDCSAKVPEVSLTAELDIFSKPGPLSMVEVEFASIEQAASFIPPDWFGTEVTEDKRYHNAHMSKYGVPASVGNSQV